MPHFAHPYILLAIIPVALLCILLYFRREPSLKIPSLTNFKTAIGGRFSPLDFRKLVPVGLLFLSMTALVVALAKPESGAETLQSGARGITVQLVLDLSGSMQVCDPPSGMSANEYRVLYSLGRLKTRLQVAKEQITAFVKQRPNDEIGLIRFADCADIVCPPTLNHDSFLLPKLNALEIDKEYLGLQTGMNAPMLMALDGIVSSKKGNGVIVLFTDGKDNILSPVAPEEIAQKATDSGVRIYTVGIGNNSMEPDSFDGEILQKIADISGGKYYHSSDEKGMYSALKDINRIEKTEIHGRRTIYTKQLYPQFALLAAVLLGLAVFARCVVCHKLP